MRRMRGTQHNGAIRYAIAPYQLVGKRCRGYRNLKRDDPTLGAPASSPALFDQPAKYPSLHGYPIAPIPLTRNYHHCRSTSKCQSRWQSSYGNTVSAML